ncbi:MAG: competence protein ComK [Erysipelotrichaceae bacterium]|nr:competence protein ComK [Erysipelotrichaceae bacterium]
MCDYLFYSYPKSCVVLVSQNQTAEIPAASIRRWMEDQAILYGSTLKGRRDAFAATMKVRKFLPAILCLNPVIIFFPEDSTGKDETRWICWQSIEKIQYTSDTAIVFFKDGMVLNLVHPRRIRRICDNIYLYVRLMNRQQPEF